MELLRFYRQVLNQGKGVPLADEMRKLSGYANEAVLLKGELLHQCHRYPEAIEAYRQYQPPSPGKTLYHIADCYKRMERLNRAIQQLREVENFYPKNASEAAMKIAGYYKEAGIRKKYIAALYRVMDKYPGSTQSSVAHDALEKMGFPSGGALRDSD